MAATYSGAILSCTSGASVLWSSMRSSGQSAEEVVMTTMMALRPEMSTLWKPFPPVMMS